MENYYHTELRHQDHEFYKKTKLEKLVHVTSIYSQKIIAFVFQIIIPIISICNFATLCRATLVLIQLSSFNDEFLVVNFGMKNAY